MSFRSQWCILFYALWEEGVEERKERKKREGEEGILVEENNFEEGILVGEDNFVEKGMIVEDNYFEEGMLVEEGIEDIVEEDIVVEGHGWLMIRKKER